ncbi:MAG: DUF6495 family protein [Bacteroidota bacterium]
MKYRRLSQEELKDLEPEFVQFLSSNTVTADDWVKLKETAPQKVEQLIGVFSDIVFEKVLSKIEYLEFRTPKDVKTFHCLKDKIILLGLTAEGENDLDFTTTADPTLMLGQYKFSDASLRLYSAEKAYAKVREAELFDMLEGGAMISKDGALFKALQALKPQQN